METKEMLEATINGLQERVDEITRELQLKKAILEDVGKPTMTENVYSLLQDTIRDAVSDISFSENDFDYEMSMEYDNKVELNYLNFNERDSMVDDIIRCIDKEFRVIENDDLPLNSGDIEVEQAAVHD